jgi:hypothetical protein
MPLLSMPVAAARRSPWMNDRAELLVRLLQERYGLQISEAVARETISEHVDHVAKLMRIGRRAAKFYVTDDVISGMTDRIAALVHDSRDSGERPNLRIVK